MRFSRRPVHGAARQRPADTVTRITANRMRLAAALLAALSVPLLAGCMGGEKAPRPARPHAEIVGLTIYPAGQRQLVPAVAGTSLDGGHLSLAGIGRGKVVFLNVWASWCTPCRAEMPMLARNARRLAPRGVRFLGLDEQDRRSAARSFVRSAGVAYPSVVDPDGTVLLRLSMLPQKGIPSSLVIDRRGHIAARVIGRVTTADLSRILAVLRIEG
jgi:thiol-disulfide isomerase/thioredoxin